MPSGYALLPEADQCMDHWNDKNSVVFPLVDVYRMYRARACIISQCDRRRRVFGNRASRIGQTINRNRRMKKVTDEADRRLRGPMCRAE